MNLKSQNSQRNCMFMNSASGDICGLFRDKSTFSNIQTALSLLYPTTKYTERQAFCPVIRVGPPLLTKGQTLWYSVCTVIPLHYPVSLPRFLSASPRQVSVSICLNSHRKNQDLDPFHLWDPFKVPCPACTSKSFYARLRFESQYFSLSIFYFHCNATFYASFFLHRNICYFVLVTFYEDHGTTLVLYVVPEHSLFDTIM
jgi:hypothetical protein